MKQTLKIGIGNSKLKNDVAIFDLPAGHSCPFAKDCAEKVNPDNGQLIVNPSAKFRCFAAVSEMLFPTVRAKRWFNFELIKKAKTTKAMAQLIIDSINANKKVANAPKMRVHSSGDFFSQTYFNAWIEVAKAMPNKIFYAYTKSFNFWVAKLDEIPANLHITASTGSKHDNLITEHGLKHVVIVHSEAEAKSLGIEIDHDDTHCYDRSVNKFALLIHGQQPKGSEASKAVSALRKVGITGYNKGNRGNVTT